MCLIYVTCMYLYVVQCVRACVVRVCVRVSVYYDTLVSSLLFSHSRSYSLAFFCSLARFRSFSFTHTYTHTLSLSLFSYIFFLSFFIFTLFHSCSFFRVPFAPCHIHAPTRSFRPPFSPSLSYFITFRVRFPLPFYLDVPIYSHVSIELAFE